MFPQRNRIVVGLSDAVVVIEGALKSGSLITAEWGRKFKKPTLASPGQITSSVASGTNLLIKSGRAKMLTGLEDVLTALGIGGGDKKAKGAQGGVLQLLAIEPMTVDELSRKLNKKVEEVLNELMSAQLMGEVEEKEGKFYRKN